MRAIAIAVLSGAVVSAQAQMPGPAAAGRGAITGLVIAGDTGTPLVRATVTLRVQDGRESRSVTTDDGGRYEFPDVGPGRYTLQAGKAGYLTLPFGRRRPLEPARPVEVGPGQRVDRIDFTLPRGAVIVARVTNEFGEPMPGVRVEVQQPKFSGWHRTLERVTGGASFLSFSDDRGEVRLHGLPPGGYYLHADPGSAGLLYPGYTATYFPGTLSMAEAGRITVGLGEEVPATFAVARADAASTISGVLLGLDGAPFVVSAGVMLRQFAHGGTMSSRGVPVQNDGTFMIRNVPPGTYTIGAANPPEGWLLEYPVTVTPGADLSGLVIQATRGGVMRGRIVFEGGTSESRSTSVAVTVDQFDGLAPKGRVTRKDDTFEATGLVGPRVVRLPPSSGWFVKAVRHQGRDVTDLPFEFGPGSVAIDGVEVVLTQRASEVRGAVVDERGQPVQDCVVVVFPDDRERWTVYSRSIGAGRPAQSGTFHIGDLPPGEYRIIAVPYLEEGSERDPDVLDRFRGRAERMTLGDGAAATISLRLVE